MKPRVDPMLSEHVADQIEGRDATGLFAAEADRIAIVTEDVLALAGMLHRD